MAVFAKDTKCDFMLKSGFSVFARQTSVRDITENTNLEQKRERQEILGIGNVLDFEEGGPDHDQTGQNQ